MTAYVYELINPKSGTRFYIGMTEDPKRRLHEHLTGQCISTAGFIEDLHAHNIKAEIQILAECRSSQEAHELERSLILEERRKRAMICNTRRGWIPHSTIPNHGKKWDNHNRQRLYELLENGLSRKSIARALGRSISSIRHALRRKPSPS